jgi:Ca-activated chloride channel homolog
MNKIISYGQNIYEQLKGIDRVEFHFLRPQFLMLFIPVLAVLLLLIASNRQRSKWKNIIAPALRPFVFTKGDPWAIILPMFAFAIGISSMIVSLSGPTWKKKEIPGAKTNAVMLIGMDLSPSMLTNDIEPNRLERAKFKLTDLLEANPRTQVGLLAIAGTTHPVLPFCTDYKIIEQQATALAPKVMPVQGRDMKIFMGVADTFMRKIGAPSTLLLITDQLNAADTSLFNRFTDRSIHRLEILLVATDKTIDTSLMNQIAENKKIIINPVTLDKTDVQAIAKRVRDKLVFTLENKKLENVWDDRGLIFLIPALLIGLLWFRRGWVIQWCWVPLLLFSSSCKPDSKHAEWWYTKDDQAEAFYKENKFEEAASLYTDDTHKAAAYFRAGDFQSAADILENDTTASGRFNRAMALASLGQFELADSLLSQVDSDPRFMARAESQRKHIREVVTAIDSINRESDSAIQFIAGNKKKKEGPLNERRPQSEDEQLSADTKVKKLPKSGDRVTDEVQSNQHIYKEAKFPPKDFRMEKPDPSGNIIMQKVNADPQEFLKRRFEIQWKKYYKRKA